MPPHHDQEVKIEETPEQATSYDVQTTREKHELLELMRNWTYQSQSSVLQRAPGELARTKAMALYCLYRRRWSRIEDHFRCAIAELHRVRASCLSFFMLAQHYSRSIDDLDSWLQRALDTALTDYEPPRNQLQIVLYCTHFLSSSAPGCQVFPNCNSL